MQHPPMPEAITAAFQCFSPKHRPIMATLRGLIFDVATADPRVGALEETLRWGEPAYLTTQTKAGSTIRLGVDKASALPALFFNCNTTLVEDFRSQFDGVLTFSKNRAILVEPAAFDPIPLRLCIAAALTYHLRRK